MIKIILLSHGPLCEGMLTTLEMIAGSQKDIYTVQLHPGESPDSYRAKVVSILEKDEDKSLVFCDLKGGTPYNTAAFLKKDHQISLITGMNLPMLISVVTSRNDSSNVEELTQIALDRMNLGVELINLKKGDNKRGKLSLNKNR